MYCPQNTIFVMIHWSDFNVSQFMNSISYIFYFIFLQVLLPKPVFVVGERSNGDLADDSLVRVRVDSTKIEIESWPP